MKIEYVCNAVKWFDKVNGNTYHSVKVTRCEDGETITTGWMYGYGEHYRQTALELMVSNDWIPKRYTKKTYEFERANDYPIQWNVTDGLKRDVVANGKL